MDSGDETNEDEHEAEEMTIFLSTCAGKIDDREMYWSLYNTYLIIK
jgi:hypothetical protein